MTKLRIPMHLLGLVEVIEEPLFYVWLDER